jgi:hypothetical protein
MTQPKPKPAKRPIQQPTKLSPLKLPANLCPSLAKLVRS